MQINSFGFPLGAGMQPIAPTGGPGLGFAAALGVALDGMPPQGAAPVQPFAMPAALEAIALTETALPGTKPMPGPLPGLQQPATLSQLMTTAAKLPTLDASAEPLAPVVEGATEQAPAVPVAQPMDVAADPAAVALDRDSAPEVVVPKPAPQGEAKPGVVPAPTLDDTIEAAPAQAPAVRTPAKAPVPVEAAPVTPRKGPPTDAATPAETAETVPAPSATVLPAELLAAAAAQAPVQQQVSGQLAPAKEAGTGKHAVGGPKVKAAAPAAGDVTAQPLTSAPQPDFERAVAAQGNAGEGAAQADTQLQQHGKPGASQPDLPAFQPTQAAAVSGSEAPRSARTEPVIEARPGHLGQSLGVEVARSVKLGEQELRIRLNPVELGRIEVKLAFDENGALQATVRAESQAALDLLRQDAPELARTLDQAGIRADAQSFRFESRADTGAGTGSGQQQRGGQSQQQHARHDDLEPAPEYRTVRGDGRVDLLA